MSSSSILSASIAIFLSRTDEYLTTLWTFRPLAVTIGPVSCRCL
jgi:hypothetical protein